MKTTHPSLAHPYSMGLLTAALVLGMHAGAGGQLALFENGGPEGSTLGFSLAQAGDVDGDGYPDLIAGGPYDDTVGTNAGTARVISGRDGTTIHQWYGDEAGDLFGYSVAGAGDLDGDGVVDLLVGAPAENGPVLAGGSISAYSGQDATLIVRLYGTESGTLFGGSVAGPGDLNGDGVPDMIVGDQSSDGLAAHGGMVRAYSGPPLYEELWTLYGAAAGDLRGCSTSDAGDVDQDGHPDVLAGARRSSAGHLGAGDVAIISGVDGTLIRTIVGPWTKGLFGFSVANAGDVDGDTIPDAIVGAPNAGDGRANVYAGADGTKLFTLMPESPDDEFGYSVDGGKDVDGDGVVDLVVGVPYGVGEGVAVFSGADGTRLFTCYVVEDIWLGYGVAMLGDVTGDGKAEVAAGDPENTSSGNQSGKAFILTWLDDAGCTWTDLGQAMAGTYGTPHLDGVGCLEPGGPYLLELSSGVSSGQAYLVIGLSYLGLPFKGGTMVPNPDLLIGPLPIGSFGSLDLSGVWPDDVPPGAPLYFQDWMPDPGGPRGYAASNALTTTTM